MEGIFADFERIVMPGITHWQHPGWFGYFPANNSPASVLGELLTAGLGAQCMVWQTSPAAAELEEVVVDWLRQMIGLPDGFSGVIQDTASTATLCAFLSARERATGFETNETGFRAALTVYASEEAHSSADKGVRIAGFGKKNLRRIATDERFALVPEKLEEALVRDKEAGLVPACVMATVGTTSSGAIDPAEGDRRDLPETRRLVPRRRRLGRDGRAPAGETLDHGRGRAGRLARLQSPQVDADQLRLHGLLRQGPGRARPDLRDPPRIPEDRRRRQGQELPRLGHPARPALPGPQALVRHPQLRRRGAPGHGPRAHPAGRRSSGNGSRPTAASSCWPRSISASSASVSTTAATRPRSTRSTAPSSNASTPRARSS
ncbi:MAG: pyridoxal-dependent decarboxylase [Comamonadaceae bacterium]|nr:pyridoxal-dependent decarboxylase [Comamonadaceae bacterium]